MNRLSEINQRLGEVEAQISALQLEQRSTDDRLDEAQGNDAPPSKLEELEWQSRVISKKLEKADKSRRELLEEAKYVHDLARTYHEQIRGKERHLERVLEEVGEALERAERVRQSTGREKAQLERQINDLIGDQPIQPQPTDPVAQFRALLADQEGTTPPRPDSRERMDRLLERLAALARG